MMTQTLALLMDAYRELQAKKMFWVVMFLNIAVVCSFALLGVKDGTLTVLWFKPLANTRLNALQAMYIYKQVFSSGIVGFWFSWLATLLALVSTAGIFPDFLSSGSVDLYLSRPISRSRLFFTKYLAALLFVTLQVSVFTLLSFLVLGLRASLWQPGLFIAIPLVVLFFSYLFAICALLGVWTRSTIAALLITLLAWFIIWGADFSERTFAGNNVDQSITVAALDDQIDAANAAITSAESAALAPNQSQGPQATTAASAPASAPAVSPDQLAQLKRRRDDLLSQRKDAEVPRSSIVAENISYGIKTVLPKTRETMNLLDRLLFSDQDLQDAAKAQETQTQNQPQFNQNTRGRRARQLEIDLQVKERERERPVWWILGTSLLFEAVVLAAAVWLFSSRDY